MKYKTFLYEIVFGINLQYDKKKSYQMIVVRFIIKKQINTTLFVILGAVGSYMLKDIEI